MATQVQRRRGTFAQTSSFTGAAGEVTVDTTNNRLVVHDATTAGGHPQTAWQDQQKNTYKFATAGGTANALTLTLSPAPAAYTNLEIKFKAASNNTGSATMNVNSLGNVTLQKATGGSLANLEADDLVANACYTAIHNGSVLVIQGVGGLSTVEEGDLGSAAVSQGKLKSTTGSASTGSSTHFTLAGGSYTFAVGSHATSGTDADFQIANNPSNTTVAYQVFAIVNNPAGGRTAHITYRYIQSSPPYDLGDGEVGGFVFLTVDRNGDVLSTWIAPDPPWANNGPTRTSADHIDASGQKFVRRRIVPKDLKRALGSRSRGPDLVPLTHAIKNADMPLIPHPFASPGPDVAAIVLADPMDARIRRLLEFQEDGEDMNTPFHRGLFRVSNEALGRSTPPGVMACRLRL